MYFENLAFDASYIKHRTLQRLRRTKPVACKETAVESCCHQPGTLPADATACG